MNNLCYPYRLFRALFAAVFSCIFLTGLLLSCATAPEEPEEPPVPSQEEREEEIEPAPEIAPDSESLPEPLEDEDTYTMDEEEYEETKRDLSRLVSELNKIIAARDYSRWMEHLTEEYQEYYSDPEVLKEYSQAPILKKHNIVLRSLQEYFNYVVVASRRNVQIDDIKAVSPNRVRAYMDVDGKSIVVYTLEKVDGSWKIAR